MDASVVALIIAVIAIARVWDLPRRLAALQEELARRKAEQDQLHVELERLRNQLTRLREAGWQAPAATPPIASAPPVAVVPPVAPLARPTPTVPPVVAPAYVAPPTPLPTPKSAEELSPAPLLAATPKPAATSPPALTAVPAAVSAPPPPGPAPVLAPAGPTWWERASALLLENWTGILGAVVLVTGVGFLGIYGALRMAPPFRFLLICSLAAGLLGARFALRDKPFARQLNTWLLSSAAAIFLFACVGAVSIPGLRWVTAPFDYLLLLAGVSANLYLAWRASREEVATLHGVLSLVALSVLPPTVITLGAAAGVTAFSIAITYRQLWKYQLLLSIASFFAFHLYWHHQLVAISNGLRLAAMGLVLLVGGAAAVVQYRRVYAERKFEPLLFAAHLLNWTCLGINLYLHSTGSIWKTIPLGLGALLTFWAGRQAKQLGITWLFQTDTIISLILALATAFSLQGWHATPTVILLFMLLESLLVALVMARQSEVLVYRVAMAGALLAGTGLLLAAGGRAAIALPPTLYRDAVVLALAGWAGLALAQFIYKQPLLTVNEPASPAVSTREKEPSNHQPLTSNYTLLCAFAGLAGLLQAEVGLPLARLLFGDFQAPVVGLLLALVALAGISLALATWVQKVSLAPSWVRRQQLVLGQFFSILAVLGLHEMGLSWPFVLLVLYAENLLVALLLNGRNEDYLLRAQTYLLVLQAALLPLLVRYAWPEALGPLGRAALLLAAALLTVGYQMRRLFWARAQAEFATFSLNAAYHLPVLGLAAGWLLLGAGSLVYERPWAGWAMVGLLGSLLYLRQRVAVPGLWAGLVLAATGYLGLQWNYALTPTLLAGTTHSASYTLRYLLPTLTVPVVGIWASWWAAGERFVRWPWLYLLGAHLVVALVAAMPDGHAAYIMIGLLALAGVAFMGAQAWRRTLPDAAAVNRAGQPDRYLLHLSYGLLLGSLLTHLWLLFSFETFFGQPAEYFTAALFFGVLVAVAVARPPATEPVYKSWRLVHPWLTEAALLFGSGTLAHHIRAAWLPLLWVGAALVLNQIAGKLPIRFRRLGVYGRFYYWLAAFTASADCLRYISPSALLTPAWWGLTAAISLLFVYVTLALHVGDAPFAGLSPDWDVLARPPRRWLEAALLYPAFLALTLLFIQSFDRSVLTVLLMLEVVAVFSTSLLLRRQDLRYLALAGMLGCLVRLVFYDLSQSGTITRAIVFIFMGLLLLGMNALYARFKVRFEPQEGVGTPEPASHP